MIMDPYQNLGSNPLDRQLAMSILMNGGSSASEAVKLARLQQQQAQQQQEGQQQGQGQSDRPHQYSAFLQQGLSASSYTPEMLRLQRDLLNREIAARAAAFPSYGVGDPNFGYLGSASLGGNAQHPPFSSLLAHQMNSQALRGSVAALGGLPSMTAAAAAAAAAHRNSPPLSPSSKPAADGATLAALGGSSPNHLKRNSFHQRDSLGGSSHSSEASNKRARIGGSFAATSPSQQLLPRGSKAKLRDDFWGKVGKNNSHIHLVNIVLGRLLFDQVKNSKGGNKVLSNDLIQQILEHKLYGKFAVREFFASANKASETVRNTWTRLNFASDNIRKGLSRYKEQTWQAIERCEFDDLTDEDKKEMEDALKVFHSSNRFVTALDVALKGIITEEFMGVLMQLRLEWNSLCLHCRPEEHDSVVAGFLRKYGLNGK